jgi:SecD/SecF fusion protein
VVPVVLAGIIVFSAFQNNWFHLGVDLSGGTILVYEVDKTKTKDDYTGKGQELADALKKRIDPADLLSATIRSVGGGDRVEIILPLRGQNKEEREEIEQIRYRIAQQGKLEFRILANTKDDKEAIDLARDLINGKGSEGTQAPAGITAELEKRNRDGTPPPDPMKDGKPAEFRVHLHGEDLKYTYEWVKLGKQEVYSLGLQNPTDKLPPSPLRKMATGEELNKAFVPPGRDFLMYSREIPEELRTNPVRLPKKDYELGKKYEFFILTRKSRPGEEVTGGNLNSESRGYDENGRWAVNFGFDSVGTRLFGDATTLNRPDGDTFYRQLAIILDDEIESAPRLNTPITGGHGQITGDFTAKQVDDLVTVLRSGALPATLKPEPVSQNTITATLGAETIHDGAWSVVIAFFAVLLFMLIYYRFAGLVACVALLANLLLTVAFMVLVKATFTLPGLAGLVLMLGMAVDANVLIYERLREERERGASLALSLRNGYDRAFPTIIDTHLSSIFTAIVLYVVGNDQLKGFGITLTVGLIISLFTSLYMTRTMFNYWQANNWLKKLSMLQLFRRPNIPFMAIRYYFFAATVILTILGAAVFIARLPAAEPDRYKVTDAALVELKTTVPPGVLAKLQPLKDQEFNSSEGFRTALASKFDKDALELYERPVMAATKERLTDTSSILNIDFIGGTNFTGRINYTYKISDQTVTALRDAKVPDAVIAKLEPLKNKEFAAKGNLDKELADKLSKAELDQFKETIASSARQAPLNVSELRQALAGAPLPDLSIEIAPATDPTASSYRFTIRTAEKDVGKVQAIIKDKLGARLQTVEMEKAKILDRNEANARRVATAAIACLSAADGQFLLDEVPTIVAAVNEVKPPQRRVVAAAVACLTSPEGAVPLEEFLRVAATLHEVKPHVQVPLEAELLFKDSASGEPMAASQGQVQRFIEETARRLAADHEELRSFTFDLRKLSEGDEPSAGLLLVPNQIIDSSTLQLLLDETRSVFNNSLQPERLENFDAALAAQTQKIALAAILASWTAILLYLWFRFGSWTFGAAAVLCLIHDLFFTLGGIAVCHYLYDTAFGRALGLGDFKIDLPAVAALLTLVGYSVNDTIVVFDRIREVRGKNPALTPQMINDSVNQTLSRTILSSLSVWLVVIVLYIWGGEGVHLFGYVMVIGVIVGTYSSIYIASPLLLIFGEGSPRRGARPQIQPATAAAEA